MTSILNLCREVAWLLVSNEVRIRLFTNFVCSQLDKLREEGPGAALTTRGPSPNMEATVMLHNIQRIIQVPTGGGFSTCDRIGAGCSNRDCVVCRRMNT